MSDQGAPPPPPVEAVIDALGGPEGGGGSGGSSGGGGGEPADPLAGYRSALLRLRIPPGPYVQLMQHAANGRWSTDEFLWALESDPRFQKTFPGINQLLDSGLSVPSAVSRWRAMYTEYKEAAQDAGLTRFARLTPKRFGMYLEEGVDVEEMLFRVSIIKQAKQSEPFRNAINAILKKKGQQALDKKGWAEFLAGRGEQAVYDLYEGALLLQELGGAGLKVKEARRLGKILTGPEGGPAFSAAGFAEAIRNVQSALGSQVLKESGLSAKELALATLKDSVSKPEARRKATAAFEQLEQMMRNREASMQEGGREAVSTEGGRPISSLAPGG